jgi:hypothetical protein
MVTIARTAYDSKIERQRDYFQVGRVHQLDAKKLSLANANGPGLLRD